MRVPRTYIAVVLDDTSGEVFEELVTLGPDEPEDTLNVTYEENGPLLDHLDELLGIFSEAAECLSEFAVREI